MLIKYDDIYLDDVDIKSVDELTSSRDTTGVATVIRVSIPSSKDNLQKMTALGFTFVDRTIKASISISKCSLDLERMVRVQLEPTTQLLDQSYETLLNVACASFTEDSRFNLSVSDSGCGIDSNNASTVPVVLRNWFRELPQGYIAILKDNPIGFISLKNLENKELSVHLAAVDMKYRLTGAGMSLYAKALLQAKEQGFKKLVGRISSKNMAVLNLYASLGAQFVEPKDVFLRR